MQCSKCKSPMIQGFNYDTYWCPNECDKQQKIVVIEDSGGLEDSGEYITIYRSSASHRPKLFTLPPYSLIPTCHSSIAWRAPRNKVRKYRSSSSGKSRWVYFEQGTLAVKL